MDFKNRIGVAISTTGDPHRLGFLETSVAGWDAALPLGASLFVTVDGDEAAVARVARVVSPYTGSVYRVGQPTAWWDSPFGIRDGRLGVAVNKNTGMELLMDNTNVAHLFLSDDDTAPRNSAALDEHILMDSPHSMVCWGRHRNPVRREGYAEWSWPRGVVLYVRRSVLMTVGGMVEQFGPGGHEHVEWSRRIHEAGLTPSPFVSPARYANHNGMGAAALWKAEDMPRPGEPLGNLRKRKERNTSVKRREGDWKIIDSIMEGRQGSSDYVPFRAHANGRQSATLSENLMGQGAGGEG